MIGYRCLYIYTSIDGKPMRGCVLSHKAFYKPDSHRNSNRICFSRLPVRKPSSILPPANYIYSPPRIFYMYLIMYIYFWKRAGFKMQNLWSRQSSLNSNACHGWGRWHLFAEVFTIRSNNIFILWPMIDEVFTKEFTLSLSADPSPTRKHCGLEYPRACYELLPCHTETTQFDIIFRQKWRRNTVLWEAKACNDIR